MRKPFLVLLVFCTLLFILIAGNPSNLFSKPLSKEIKAKKIEAESLKREVTRINDNLEIAIENYNESKEKLAKISKKISVNYAAIENAKNKLINRQMILGKRAGAMYRYGNVAFIEVVLNSNNFSDFINRLYYLLLIAKKDSDLIKQIKETKQLLTDKMNQLQIEKNNQLEEAAVLKSKKSAVLKALAYQKQLLKNNQSQIADLEKKQRDEENRLQREAIAAQKQREQELAKLASTKNNSGTGSVNHWNPVGSNNIVNIAMQYLGVPYVWGGTTPAGFDCSGFTSYVFRKAGVSIPRTSRAQFSAGTPVSRSDLKPGDLVFFGSPTIHHVGIYIGNDSMIDAPQTGDNVRVRSFSRHREFRGARRYI